jgi:uncharacterized membrane protein YccC
MSETASEAVAIAVTLGTVIAVAAVAFGVAEVRRRRRWRALSAPLQRRRGYDWSGRG